MDNFFKNKYTKLILVSRDRYNFYEPQSDSTRNINFRNKRVYSRSLLCSIHVQESVAAGTLSDARDERCNTAARSHVLQSLALPSRCDKSSYLRFRGSQQDITYESLFRIVIIFIM